MKKQLVNTVRPLRSLAAAALLSVASASSLGLLPGSALAASNDEAALNFVGADIESVIKAVGHYTNITFVIDPRVKGTLTLVSEHSISKSQAFALLTSALRLQGYAVVAGDGYTKVVPEAEAKLQPGPTHVSSGSLPLRGDQVVTQVFNLNFESASNLVTVLRPLITPNNTINATPGSNAVVITDYADNLQRLAKIIAALDAPSATDLDVIPVRYAIASDLATMLNKLLEPGAAATGGESNRITVMADSRTNELVLRAPSRARANLAKSLIAKLDQPTAQPGNIHVVYLKNADSTKLAQTLRSVVSFDTSTPSTQGGTSGTGTGTTGSNTAGSSGTSGTSTTSGTGSSGPSSSALTANGNKEGSNQGQSGNGAAGFIQADSSTNSLIITAPEAVYRNLRRVIDQLDVRRAEVYIESLIVEVSATTASNFGVQWAALSGDSNSAYRVGSLTSFGTGSSNLVTLAQAGSAATPSTGLTLGVFKQVAGSLTLGAVVNALQSDSSANILSTPNLITLDNELATIQVGQNVPIITGTYATTTTTTSNPFTTVDRKDVGLTLKVRPQISEGGTIKMAIYHETSSVDSTTTSSTSGVTINKRVIENNVVADDGQIIVLGGLISDTTSADNEGVPGLADIPFIGNLFKYKTRSRAKTNLMVFLRPVIVRSKEQSASLAADRYAYMKSQQVSAPPTDNSLVHDLGMSVLPPLVNGQPTGGDMLVTPPPIDLRRPQSTPTAPETLPGGITMPAPVTPVPTSAPTPAQ